MPNNIRILVVEDDENLANNIASFLSDFSEVDIENDGLSGSLREVKTFMI